MRKLIAQQFATVDNIAAEPDGGMTFVDDYVNLRHAEFQRDADAFMDTIDTMLLGATTYKMFLGYWPEASHEGAFGDKLNNLTKHVASRTLAEAPWGEWSPASLTTDPVALVRKLKQEPGKDIVLWGSLQLMYDLAEAGEIDEYYLRITPESRGQGRRVFTGTTKLHLQYVKPYDHGVVVARYQVAT